MGDWFLAEVRTFTYTQGVPTGWLECAGQTLAIKQNQGLFSLLGTQFGGDGQVNFALPDLRGRVPVGAGMIPDSNRVVPTPGALAVGAKGGSETVALTSTQMPAHTHSFGADPANAVPGPSPESSIPSTCLKGPAVPVTAPAAPNAYAAPSTPAQPLIGGLIKPSGSNAGHENRQPFVALRYCIATSGIYPSRA